MSKQLLSPDYEHTVNKDILSYLTRTEKIEQIARSFENEIEIKNMDWDNNVYELKKNIMLIREELKFFNKQKEEFKDTFMQTVQVLKKSATSQDFEILKQMVEGKKFEELINRNEFKRISNFQK